MVFNRYTEIVENYENHCGSQFSTFKEQALHGYVDAEKLYPLSDDAVRTAITNYGDNVMGDKNTAGNVGFMGGHDNQVSDVTINQQYNTIAQTIDLDQLASELADIRKHLRQDATEPEHDIAIAAIAQAEAAAKAGDGAKAVEYMSKAGKWAWDKIEKISVAVIAAAIKTQLGM